MSKEQSQKAVADITIKEYTKEVFAFCNHYGAAFHTISAKCNNPQGARMNHTFGNDESINKHLALPGIKQANSRFLENRPPDKNSDYAFYVFSIKDPKKPVSYKELGFNKLIKTFSVDWESSFGLQKEAAYYWGWINPLMFSNMDTNGKLHSSLKVSLPAKRLIFRIYFQFMYPLQENPKLLMINRNGKVYETAETMKTDFRKEKRSFKITDNKILQSFPLSCYKVVIDDPIVGNTYQLEWEMNFEKIHEYLEWYEATH